MELAQSYSINHGHMTRQESVRNHIVFSDAMMSCISKTCESTKFEKVGLFANDSMFRDNV